MYNTLITVNYDVEKWLNDHLFFNLSTTMNEEKRKNYLSMSYLFKTRKYNLSARHDYMETWHFGLAKTNKDIKTIFYNVTNYDITLIGNVTSYLKDTQRGRAS